MTLFEGNLPQRRQNMIERERNPERKSERKRNKHKEGTKGDGKRAGERTRSMPNNRATARNRAHKFKFLSANLPVL